MALSAFVNMDGIRKLLNRRSPEQFNAENDNSDRPLVIIPDKVTPTKMVLMIVDLLIFIYALYLSFKCKGKFKLGDFLFACCCSPCYVAYRLAIGCK